MRYFAYSLQIDCDIPLGQLLPRGRDDLPADVLMHAARIDDPAEAGAVPCGPLVHARRGGFWLDVPRVARFQVIDGCEIRVEPAPEVDPATLRLFLLGTPLGALMSQRGHLVMHGNAIRVGDRCAVCVGPSGIGKSTLAAAFMQRGHAVLADDVVPIDSDGRALGGYPRIKLWQDAAERLRIATPGLEAVRPQLSKFHVPTTDSFVVVGEALPVRWIYVLDRHNRADVAIEPVSGLDRFEPLRENTYRPRFIEPMGLQADQLRLASALAGRIRMAQVRRPQDGFALDALADRLLEDMAAHP